MGDGILTRDVDLGNVIWQGVVSSPGDLPKLVAHSLYKSLRWRERLREVAVAASVDPDRTALETDPTDLGEGLYVKVEDPDTWGSRGRLGGVTRNRHAYNPCVKRALLILALSACTKTSQLPEESWGAADYAAAGIAIDKSWSVTDFETAATLLGELAKDHPERLPRYRGAKSGDVFAKLAAEVADDRALPLGDRFVMRARHYEAVNKISKLYVRNQLAPPTREWVELMGVLLRDAAVETELAEPFLATIPADDPSRPTREHGIAKMRQGFGGMLYGALLVADDRRVSDDARLSMLAHVTAALPRLFPALPAEVQHNIRELLAKQVRAFPSGPLRDAIVAAQQAVPSA